MNTSITITPDQDAPKYKSKLDPKYDKVIDILADALLASIAKGTPLAKINKTSDKELSRYYSIAYNFYLSEKYDQAKEIFSYLCLNNHTDKKLWMGLAGCCQMLKQYPQALTTYAHIKLMDPSDPLPFFHAFTCYIELKKYPEALSALEAVILRSLKKSEYAELKKHAEAMKKLLLDTINQK